MSELPEYRYIHSKDEIKSRLPVAFACSRLGIRLTGENTAICPFHAGGQERNPSLNIYVNERGEERWHCFPCGLDGDVFDLISNLTGCTFADAIVEASSILDDLPEGYVRPQLEAPPKMGPADWGEQVQAARNRAAQPDHEGILAARVGFADVSDSVLCAEWDKYLRYWGWGINELGEILIPHWSREGALVGCKVRRPGGGKESLSGSIYKGQLYGAWWGRKHQDVFITEGESDCLYAYRQARVEGIELDVYSLPSGAGDDVAPEWVEFLKGARTVYLTFDPDGAGVEATWRWTKALQDFDVRVCCLPLCKDLRDAQPQLRHLLSAAQAPLIAPTEISVGLPSGFPAKKLEKNVGYFRPTKDDGPPRQVTNWFVEPIARLSGGDPGYDVTLFHRGRGQRTIIRLADLASSREIKKWCNKHGLVFTGREDDLQRIAEHVTWRASVTPEIYQTDQVGLHYPPDDYKFAGPSVVFPSGYVGKMPWRYVPSARASDVTDKVLLPVEERFTWSWLDDFLKLSSSNVIHPLLAWTIAAARRPEVRQFPILFIGGSSGVGKSTLARLAMRLTGSSIEIDLGAVTPFILLRTLASSTSLPIFIDEWTLMSRKDAREAFQGTIPVLYTGGSAERGQADLSSALYSMSAPVIVAGEDTFALDRELDRTVCISPTRRDQNSAALARITQVPLERFGQVLHRWIVTRKGLPEMENTAPTRPEYNREILMGGWRTLQLLLEDASHAVPNVPDIPDVPDFSLFDAERDEANVYETALLEGLSMRDSNGHQVIWVDPEGKGTWVRFRVLIGLLRTRNVDLQLPGGERAMKRYFEERYGQVESQRVVPPQSGTAVHAGLIPGFIPDGEDEAINDPRTTWTP